MNADETDIAIAFKRATDDDAAPQVNPSVAASSLDLQVEVQTILDSNLMLERADDLQDMPVQPEHYWPWQAAAETRAETEIDAAARDTMPDELPVDSAPGKMSTAWRMADSPARRR